MDNFLAKANMEMNFIFPPAKARGKSTNRNVALAHSKMIYIYKLALAKSHSIIINELKLILFFIHLKQEANQRIGMRL